uniref:Nematode cuticle collagen N-terminal domain-containing protein n=1 Tax=Panagrolaimus superbus TaxID=310955 RepID=A0A914YP58_9BILA
MRSSTSRYFLPTSSASNRNLNNIFESKRHPNSLVHGYTESINDKNFSFLRYLGYSTIAIGITVITVTIVFLPYIFASLDGTKEIVKSNGDVFKAKSNTLWSQMQSLKRNIYRRSIAADSVMHLIDYIFGVMIS